MELDQEARVRDFKYQVIVRGTEKRLTQKFKREDLPKQKNLGKLGHQKCFQVRTRACPSLVDNLAYYLPSKLVLPNVDNQKYF